MTTLTITVTSRGQTAERAIHRRLGRAVPGLVEATLAANPGLAGLGVTLPPPTTFTVTQPSAADLAAGIDVVQLID